MKTLKRIAWGLGVILVIATSLQLAAPKAVHAVISTLVTVANTAANPVPVTGTVAIAGTPAVNVASMPPVSVGPLTVSGPLPVTNPLDELGFQQPLVTQDSNLGVRQAFLIADHCSGLNCLGASGISVPTGFAAVVEDLSGSCTTNNGFIYDAYLFIEDPANPIQVDVPVTITLNRGSGINHFAFGRPVHVVLKAGSTAYLLALGQPATDASSGEGSCNFSYSGYYVSLPTVTSVSAAVK